MSEMPSPFTHPDIIPEPPTALFGSGHTYAVTPNGPVTAVAVPSLLPDVRLDKSAEPVERITDETELFRLVLAEILKVDKVKEAIAAKKPYSTSVLSRRLNDVNGELTLGIFPNTPLRARIMKGLVQNLGTLGVKVETFNAPSIGSDLSSSKEPDTMPSIEIIAACGKVIIPEILKWPTKDYPLNSLTHRVHTWLRNNRHPKSMGIHIVSALKQVLENDHEFNVFPQTDRPLNADGHGSKKPPKPSAEEDSFSADENLGDEVSEDLDSDLDDVGSDEYEDVDFEDLGIEPGEPTKAKPGSEEKVLVLAARYAAGLPFWNQDDAGNGATEEQDLAKAVESRAAMLEAARKRSAATREANK